MNALARRVTSARVVSYRWEPMKRKAPAKAVAARRVQSVRAVMNALRKIVRGLRLSARAAERTAGISSAQLFVLQSLSEQTAASLNDLAERVCTDQSSVSVVVRRLVERRLVTRKASETDGRRVELTLTAAGMRLLRRCPEPTQTQLLNGLQRMQGSDLSALRRGLELLVDAVGADEKVPMFFADEAVTRRPKRATGPRRAARRA
jgi:DNA-binding MarR family transcriptional regulator